MVELADTRISNIRSARSKSSNLFFVIVAKLAKLVNASNLSFDAEGLESSSLSFRNLEAWQSGLLRQS